jgi:serine protease AprX
LLRKYSSLLSITLIISFLQFLPDHSFSQFIRPDSIAYCYLVYFKDKGPYQPGDKLEKGSEAYKLAESELSTKALWRRAKVLPEDEVVSYIDLPVYKDYTEQIEALGFKLNAVSKWFNAVSVFATTKQLDKIIVLDFVDRIEGVHFLEKVDYPSTKKFHSYTILDTVKYLRYNYGPSYWQNEQINVPILHYCGITGWGVTIGMCDDGCNWRQHQALKDRKVLGEYDWIFKDDSIQCQFPPDQYPEDTWDQDAHGTTTLSTIGGFYEGELIGPAFDASFYLSKTEDDRDETPVEEDYWLQAVEWMEAQGIDVLSCSLIYKPYDFPNNSYSYPDMDGRTTVIVRAAEIAVHLGVVVCNSMGNEGQKDPPSIVSPPDGDSVISVGAVDSAGVIVGFSSNGPTSDGRIKPDVVAEGEDVWTAVTASLTGSDSIYSYASGTSYSCPLTAGVCALIISAHPELTPMQVKEALKMTANNKDSANNTYGWGLVNAYDAILYGGMVMSNKPDIKFDDDNVDFYVYVLSKNLINTDSVTMYYCTNDSGVFYPMNLTLIEKLDENNSGRYTGSITWNGGNILKFYFTAEDSNKKISLPYYAPERFFMLDPETKQLQLY